MSRHYPLTCKDVKKILKNLGFNPRPQQGTSHEQWVKYDEAGKLLGKVTVDCPKAVVPAIKNRQLVIVEGLCTGTENPLTRRVFFFGRI